MGEEIGTPMVSMMDESTAFGGITMSGVMMLLEMKIAERFWRSWGRELADHEETLE